MGTETLGGEVRRVRLALGLTQGELGRMIDIDQGAISDIESGKTMPGVERLRRLAEALRVPYRRLAEMAGYLDPEGAKGAPPSPLALLMEEMVRQYPELAAQFADHRNDPDFALQVRDLARILGVVARGLMENGTWPKGTGGRGTFGQVHIT